MEGFFDFIGTLIAAPFICMGWLIVGFLAGGLARYIMRSRDRPFWNDIILGLIGALIGGFLISGIFGYDPDTSGLGQVVVSLVIATAGASLLIFAGRAISNR